MHSNKKILLVENEKSIADIVSYLLKSWEYDVIVVQDGLRVLDAVKREPPDLIIIDADIPGLDGFKVIKVLKDDFLTSHIPVILLIEKRRIRKRMLEIEQGLDDYMIKPPDPIDLEVRIEMVLRRTEHQFQANALTKLPGNKDIEKVIVRRISENRIFSVAYCDVNNFKSFNDKYGYMFGDAVIRNVAHIISRVIKLCGNKDDFMGHIGGDDFIFVTTPDREEFIAALIISEFDRIIAYHYNKEDRLKGFIVAQDRMGKTVSIPLMSLTIAIANNKQCKIQNILELTEIITEIKCYLKTQQGSNYLINRRVENRGTDSVRQHRQASVIERYHKAGAANRKIEPLGQRLLKDRLLDESQLNEALKRHWDTGKFLGETLIDMGLINHRQLVKILEERIVN